ncbi:SDR family oxidoreductase [Paractinoplanes lichenicola]|uniref:NAD(P)H-binding protein n=1 Tax=Paractinoplanes lichenicola TaxID=2802976 RepID=A0ABS1VL78_9ACTN|nr:NAD(P)H-binding protein [Actinoplanes lichenicola]MBL7255474.1 NAD(P)H-binding protein [Actinoplanes lichenicola]
MRMAVAGGTGWVGKLVVERARAAGHEVVVISRSNGVDLTTGAGLDEALRGVDAVIDVTNIETLSGKTAGAFFETATRTLLAAEERSLVRHHVVLSIVGVDRVDSGYYAAKRLQEKLALDGPIPATVLRATQFHEFAAQMLERVPGPVKIVPSMLTRPVAAADVATELVRLAEGPAQGLATDLAGPEVLKMSAMVRRLAKGKLVLTVPAGRAMAGGGLLPAGDFHRGEITFDEWVAAR